MPGSRARSVSILDYGAGNIVSVKNALQYLGCGVDVVHHPGELLSDTAVILPGVGNFGSAITAFRKAGFNEWFDAEIREGGRPFLGICLGFQFLARLSEEAEGVPGLGVVDDDVVSLSKILPGTNVPRVGFDEVRFVNEGGQPPRDFYFSHSYGLPATSEAVVGVTGEGGRLAAMVKTGNVWGVQFHPEKSQVNGLDLLDEFLSIGG